MTHQPPPIPPGCSVQDMVHLGPAYATVIQVGKKGASNIVHITPLGHQTLGERLRGVSK